MVALSESTVQFVSNLLILTTKLRNFGVVNSESIEFECLFLLPKLRFQGVSVKNSNLAKNLLFSGFWKFIFEILRQEKSKR